jgi:hypothetical protein
MCSDLLSVAKRNVEEFLLRKNELLEVKVSSDQLLFTLKINNHLDDPDEKDVKEFVIKYGGLILVDGHEVRSIWDGPIGNDGKRRTNDLSDVIHSRKVSDLIIPEIRSENTLCDKSNVPEYCQIYYYVDFTMDTGYNTSKYQGEDWEESLINNNMVRLDEGDIKELVNVLMASAGDKKLERQIANKRLFDIKMKSEYEFLPSVRANSSKHYVTCTTSREEE